MRPILIAMSGCPQCDHPFGPLPGVPARLHGAFTEDVTCPECGERIQAGSRIVTGSRHAAALQPISGMRRAGMVLLAVMPFAMYAYVGFQGVLGLAGRGRSSGLVLDALAATGLVVMPLIAWAAWRRWRVTQSETGERRSAASRELCWVARPGTLEIVDRTRSAVGHRRTALRAEDLQVIHVHEAPEVAVRPGERARNVVLLSANFRKRDAAGRRPGLQGHAIYVDAGGGTPDGPAQRTRHAVAAGERLAASITATLGGRPDDPVPWRDLPAGDSVVIHGTPRPAVPAGTARTRACMVSAAFAVGTMLLAVPAFLIAAVPAGSALLGGAVLSLVTGALAFAAARGVARGRRLTRTTWVAGPGALDVVLSHVHSGAQGAVAGTRSIRIGPSQLATIACERRAGRSVLVARSRRGRELALLDPDPVHGPAPELPPRLLEVILRGRTAAT